MAAVRLQQYPPLPPPRNGRTFKCVLPPEGDLHLRSLSSDVFLQQLVIHCTSEHRHVYDKFIFIRRFLVMSRDGDIFTKSLQTQLCVNDLPGRELKPMPVRLAAGDIVKVLDIVQCYTFTPDGEKVVPNVRWELVRVRWRNLHETWIPIELMASQPITLLHEFYMSTMNSWCFRDRLPPDAFTKFETEIELWLKDSKLQKFYDKLRRRHALIANANGVNSTAPETTAIPEPTADRLQPQQQPIEDTAANDSTPTAPPTTDKPSRRRKRLRKAAEDSSSDESDDLLELTRRTNSSSQRGAVGASTIPTPTKTNTTSQRGAVGASTIPTPTKTNTSTNQLSQRSSNHVNEPTKVSNNHAKQPTKASKPDATNQPTAPTVNSEKKRKKKRQPSSENTNSTSQVVIDADAADFSDANHIDTDNEQDQLTNSGLLGRIRCVCGAPSVGRYAGQWLQCGLEPCGVWQHAECVGFLDANTNTNTNYRCSQCDSQAYTNRRREATTRLRKWLTVCCKTKNQRLLLQLLAGEEIRDVRKAVALAASVAGGGRRQRTLLMEAARNGLTRAVRRLVRRYRVDVYATDAQSRNVLHFVAESHSVAVATFLLSVAPALMRHQDLRGQMPLHLLLQSPSLNRLAVAVLKADAALCVTSDFNGEAPVHFACRVVNSHTVEAVRCIVDADPSAVVQPSAVDGLSPLLLLCRASGGVDRDERDTKAHSINQIIRLIQDRVDVLGRFLRTCDSRGWTAVHYAAASGNGALVRLLIHHCGLEVDAIAFDTSETALHVAARGSSVDAVRALLENRANPLAVDASRFIPVLRASDAGVRHELLCHDLEGQLRKVSDLARLFQYREQLREWLSVVVGDPDSFDIVNDCLQSSVDLVDELDELLFFHRSLVRVDTKLVYLYTRVLAPWRRPHQDSSQPHPDPEICGREVVLSTAECYWTQCVILLQNLDAVEFRKPLRIVISRGGSSRVENTTLVLVRLLSGLLQPTTGILTRDAVDATLRPSTLRIPDSPETLTGFYVLGELVASLVIQRVAVGEILEFSTSFLQCVVGLPPSTASVAERIFADSFAGGFSAVLPSTLQLLHAHELRMVMHAGRAWSLQPLSVNWPSAIEWTRWDKPPVEWWTRLTQELVEEERVSLLLWLAGSYRHAQKVLCATTDATVDGRVRVHSHTKASVDEDELLPTFSSGDRTLVLPQYSTYADFRVGVLHVLRHVDHIRTIR